MLSHHYRNFLYAIGICLSALLCGCFSSSSESPDPKRFADQIAAFDDAANPDDLSENPIVFVGSSSIRGWNIASQLTELPILNRGFGGSQLSDLNYYIEQTVLRYEPSLVVVYAGENDIDGGKSSQQVAQDYRSFTELLSSHNSAANIIFISIKPTPKRRAKWDDMHAANQLIDAFSATNDNYYFLDISAAMLNEDMRPIPSLYVADGIHMTPAGYDIWTQRITPLLNALYAPSSGVIEDASDPKNSDELRNAS